MCHVPGGPDGYRRLIRVHTSLDLDAAEIHQIGLDEIARIDVELAELAGRRLGHVEPGGRPRPAAQRSRRCTSRPATSSSTTAAACLARATRGDPRLVRPPADARRARSSAWAPHEEEHSTIAYYRQPAIDGSRPGQYFLNTAEPETRPRYELEALTYHESIPGHHLQIAIGQELPHLPEFRRHLGPTAFFEGWGLYTERLCDEMGLYSGDLDRIGILSFDAWRAARLVVDTGIHAMGWTRDAAIAFMLEHTALAPNNIANEVDRYIVLARPGARLQDRPARDPPPARRGRGAPRRPVRHPRLPRRGARQRRARPADAAGRRRGLGHGSARRGLMADDRGGGSATPLGIAARSLLGVLRNRDIRSLELGWTLGVAADWALLVVALLVAYDAGGAVLVGLVSLTRMIPATAVNLVVDTSRFAAARAGAGRGQPRPRRWRGARGGRQRRRRHGAVFAAVALASAAGALVRPTP